MQPPSSRDLSWQKDPRHLAARGIHQPASNVVKRQTANTFTSQSLSSKGSLSKGCLAMFLKELLEVGAKGITLWRVLQTRKSGQMVD